MEPRGNVLDLKSIVSSLCLVFAAGTAIAQPSPEGVEFFENHVRPVLAEHCVECHGPDKQKNGLRLDTREAFFKGGDAGPVVQAGNPGASLIMRALRHEGDVQMPPAGKLDDGVVQAIEQWIAIGAPWPEGEGAAPIAPLSMEQRMAAAREKLWSLRPVQNPAPPSVQHPEQIANGIDAFVLAKLEEQGLTMSPRADKRDLLRRLHYTLTGLPPTAEQVEAFANDPDPGAYARIVEELLASPRYGERWGRHWLDVARYADTKGYVFMEERTYPYSYTYRDYVIRAFNDDMPFDQFVRHQLAADMMDLGQDKRPLAALGFLTLGRRFINNIHDITDDRIDVATRGLLGLTVSCARCHEHKYDPISDADYYALYGVFRSATETPEPPIIAERSPDDPLYQEFLKAVAEKEKNLADYLTDKHSELLTHAREKLPEYLQAAFDAREMDDEGLRGLSKDRELRWPLVQRWRDYIKAKKDAPDGIWGPLWTFAALPAEAFEAPAAELAKKFNENNDPALALNRRIADAFGGDPPKTMAEVIARYGKVLKDADASWRDLVAARVQIAAQSGAAPAVPAGLPDTSMEEIRQIIHAPGAPPNMTVGEMETFGDVPLRDAIRDRKNQIMAVKASHPGRPDGAQALQEITPPFEPYVFVRGKPENRGPDVKRRFLSVLGGSDAAPFQNGSGRLELAEAIVNKENPLTARVFVNRVWAQHFGKPLVATPSDFGVRSDPPSHPELLDYLARYLMDNNWSVKALQRLIVTSYAYQQASSSLVAAADIDPENRLLWRQNRKRLDFEGLRDSLLLAAGGLDLTMGGPSVNITEPPYTKRRTVYSFIDRQNLPGVFRTFDFASPDAHTPRRFLTTVPQQALFMMNSPFVVEQARALASRPELAAAAAPPEGVRALYRLLYQREPAPDELALGEQFLGTAKAEPPQPSPWQYGHGAFDPAAFALTAFTPYPYFGDGAWKGGKDVPDATLGWSMLTSGGGHPGRDNSLTAVRRWVAPMDGVLSVEAELSHGSECGDGVAGYIVSSTGGKLWEAAVKYTKAQASLTGISVMAGDVLDFIVAPGADENCDGFSFAPTVRYTELPGASALGVKEQTEWNAIIDFAGPMPPPLQPLEQYAQVLMLSNEFAFVD